MGGILRSGSDSTSHFENMSRRDFIAACAAPYLCAISRMDAERYFAAFPEKIPGAAKVMKYPTSGADPTSGAAHDWRNNIREWNAARSGKFSLINVIPETVYNLLGEDERRRLQERP